MQHSGIMKNIGFQRLTCRNPGCSYVLKEVCFFEGWAQMNTISDGVTFIKDNGASYYLCPKCNAKNIVTEQGEKIIIEKITGFELA
jgi:hypothetical protein